MGGGRPGGHPHIWEAGGRGLAARRVTRGGQTAQIQVQALLPPAVTLGAHIPGRVPALLTEKAVMTAPRGAVSL